MIDKNWVFTCDWCGREEYVDAIKHSKRSAENIARNDGWIIGSWDCCSLECNKKKLEDFLKEDK